MKSFLVLTIIVISQLAIAGIIEQSLRSPEVDKCYEEATSTAELNACASLDLEQSELEMNQQIRTIKAKLSGQDESPEMLERFEKSQTQWVLFRTTHCQFEGVLMLGGSGEEQIILSCQAKMTKERTRQLKTFISEF